LKRSPAWTLVVAALAATDKKRLHASPDTSKGEGT
jgi:hypothetical protein